MVGYVSVNDISILIVRQKAVVLLLILFIRTGIVRYEIGITYSKVVFDHLNINRYEGKCLCEHTTSQE